MLRAVASIPLLLLIVTQSFSQGEDNSLKGVSAKERIVTGGGLGLSFGSSQDFFSVSPVIGYMVTKKFIAGTGVTYRYTNFKFYKLKLNDYGVNPFLRYIVYKNIFLQTEYEYLNYEFPLSRTETTREYFNSILAGGGFVQPLGRKTAFYLMALYNFSYQNTGVYSPYDSPLIIRAGVNIAGIGF